MQFVENYKHSRPPCSDAPPKIIIFILILWSLIYHVSTPKIQGNFTIHCAWHVNYKDYETSNKHPKWRDATERFIGFLSQYNLIHVLGVGSGSEYLPSSVPKTHNADLFQQPLCQSKIDTKLNRFAIAKISHLHGRGSFSSMK